MMIYRSIEIFVLILGLITLIKCNQCEHVKQQFANVTATFIQCSLTNAEPVHYCSKCVQNFASVLYHYQELLNATDPSDKSTCKSKYIDRDRLNIVQSVYLHATSLWEGGSCSNCFDWIDGEIVQKRSNSTEKFFNALGSFENCSATYNKDTKHICEKCATNYTLMNEIYTNIDKATKDNICFDIVDAMNKTRLLWSSQYHCINRTSTLTAFIVTSSFIGCVIPFVFYTSFMFFGWRRRQQYDPLMDSEPQQSPVESHQSESFQHTEAIMPLITDL